MSTVIPNETTLLGDDSSKQPAPKKVLENTYEAVLSALKNNRQIILITGAGKSALIHTICKNIAVKNRIITLSGKDLPSVLGSKDNNNDNQLNNIKDFILESTDIGDELVIVLDDADCLPINFLGELIERTKQSASNNNRLQLLLSGPLKFKDQLLAIKHLSAQNLSHFPLDSLNKEEIYYYAKNKSYKISSNIKRIEFKPEALQTLTDFIQSDQPVLDVVLEWCAALVNKDQLTYISTHTVNRAANFAKQYSKDKNLRLSNSFPPSGDVYKYINNFQSAKTKQNSANRTHKKSINKLNKNKTTVQSSIKSSVQESIFPAITSKANGLIENDSSIPRLDETSLQKLHKIEDELMPAQWTPSSKTETVRKNSFSAMAGLLSVLVLSFIAFIAFRIGSDPITEEVADDQVTLRESEKTITENQITNEVSKSNQDTTVNIEIQDVLAVDEPPPAVEIIANETEKPVLVTENDKESPLLAISQKQSQLPDSAPTKELTQESPQQPLVEQETTNPIDNSSLTTEINNLLVLAESQLENKNLSTPPGNNALETYQKILEKSPDNKAAINGVNKVRDKYLNWANYYFQNNELKRAKYFYNKALSVDPTDTVAITNLQAIAQQEIIATTKLTNEVNTVVPQNSDQAVSIQNLLVTAEQNMQQIEIDIGANNRNYSSYQEAQIAYQDVLRFEPQNQQAKQGLSTLKIYYADWAELQAKSKNYNIALFLYGQALAIEPGNSQIAQRIEQLLELKQAL